MDRNERRILTGKWGLLALLRSLFSIRLFATCRNCLALTYFNLVSWYDNLFVKNKARLARVVNQTGNIFSIKQLQLCDLYQQALRRKAVQIHHDVLYVFLVPYINHLSYCFYLNTVSPEENFHFI